jgi:hypothetical protein
VGWEWVKTKAKKVPSEERFQRTRLVTFWRICEDYDWPKGSTMVVLDGGREVVFKKCVKDATYIVSSAGWCVWVLELDGVVC